MNKVVHFEIPADDLDRAKKFYKEVFGWEIADVPEMDYTIVKTVATDGQNMPTEPGAINGGIMKRQAAGESPVLVIDVPSIDEYLKKVESYGSKVIMPKMKVGNMGFYARITDTEGNIIGIWEDIMQQEDSKKAIPLEPPIETPV